MTVLTVAGSQGHSPEGQVVLRLDDDLDVTSLAQITSHLEQAAELMPARITIDLSDCRFLDPQVAGTVLTAVGQLRLRGIRTLFRGCRPQVARLFALLEPCPTDRGDRRELVA
jgi:anti-anti-sigma factor